jgi:DNA-directed RNA polymerase subunit RPC12/RpoP
MALVVNKAITLIDIPCCNCGGTFAIDKYIRDHKLDNGGYILCPYCGMQLSWTETTLEKTRRELAELECNSAKALAKSEQQRQAAIDEAKHFRLSRDRLLSRANKGLCPHCNRYFKNIHRHIECKHKP